MARSKQSRTGAAEKALQRAIAEETTALQVELRQKDAEILRLRALLNQVVNIAAGAAKNVPAAVVAPPPRPAPSFPLPTEEPEPEAPQTELAGEDNMGSGRWV